jgi:hypothetical protein
MAWTSFRFGRFRVSNRGMSARMGSVRVGKGWRSGGRRASGGGFLALLGDYLASRPRDLTADELRAAPDDIKERAWQAEIAEAKAEAGQAEREMVEGWTDEEAEAALATELRKRKRRESPAEFERFLASLPTENRLELERIMREHRV